MISGHTGQLRRFQAEVRADESEARKEIVDYCVTVVDQSLDEKRVSINNDDADPAMQRKLKGALFAEEVKACNNSSRYRHVSPTHRATPQQRNQIHYELSVEKIVRNRSLQGETIGVVQRVLGEG